jgi:hypothetical protein
MDLATDKMLTVKESFEIPQILKLEMVGEGGGILNLDNTLKLTGTLQFSAPDYTLENGTLELNDGSLLDVDYHTIIDSDIVLLGNTTVDVAQGVSLEYRGNAMDLLNYQLTFLGSGTFLNTNAILLSDSGSLLILAGDITIVLIEVTGNSAAGKGIRVESAGASVTNLNLLADMGLTFIDDAYVLNVENLNVNSPAQLTGDGNGGWLKVLVLGQNTANDKLTLHDINVSVEDEIDVYFEGQIVMTGNTIFDSIGGLTFNLNGAMNFNGTVNANINLNQGIMCITDNTTLVGNIRHRADSLIFIAPEAVLTYQGTNPLNVNDMTLAIQGGGRFSSWDNNSITLNEDGGTLRLADNATTLSHLAFGAIVTNAVLDIEKNEDSICSGDNIEIGRASCRERVWLKV